MACGTSFRRSSIGDTDWWGRQRVFDTRCKLLIGFLLWNPYDKDERLPLNTPPINRDEEIFAAAASLPEPERLPYLAEACGDDEELRERIGQLLASYRETEFMCLPAAPLGELVGGTD
jgi:hypothetical protein